MRSLGWVLIQSDQCPYKERRLGHKHTQRRDQMKTLGKTATYKPRTESSGETSRAITLILDLQPSEPQERKFLLFKSPSCWYSSWQLSRQYTSHWGKATNLLGSVLSLVCVGSSGVQWRSESMPHALPGMWFEGAFTGIGAP